MNNCYLMADLGATFSDVALFNAYTKKFTHEIQYLSRDFSHPIELLQTAINHFNNHEITIDALLLAIAAPITETKMDAELKLTNNHWQFSISALKHAFPMPITIMNDFKALAYSFSESQPSNYPLSFFLTERSNHSEQNQSAYDKNESQVSALIGTGSGFGTATIVRHESKSTIIPSEGGFSLYAPQDAYEAELMRLALKEKSPIIGEDFLSGKQGINRLIRLMAIIENQSITFDSPKTLLHAALKEDDSFARLVLDRYCAMLGNIAANIALITGVNQSLYIGGGFAPRCKEFIKESSFYHAFTNRSAVENQLKEIAVAIIIDPHATLLGLKEYLYQQRGYY